jgi:putative flippase GtrA
MTGAGDNWKTRGVRWLKFNLVGAIGITVQLIVLTLLKSEAHVHYLVATALAVEAAVIHNFIWHERFTWSDRVQRGWRDSLLRFLKFNGTTGAFSIAGNLLLMRMLVGAAHLPYLPANIASIATCSVINFMVSEWFVFRAPTRLAAGQVRADGLPRTESDGGFSLLNYIDPSLRSG